MLSRPSTLVREECAGIAAKRLDRLHRANSFASVVANGGHALPDIHPPLALRPGSDSSRRAAREDPIAATDLSNTKRSALFDELNTVCNNYILGDLQDALKALTAAVMDGCRVTPDEDDAEKQTLLIEYPTLFPSSDMAYVLPRLKIEGGARSALVPIKTCVVKPYIADDLDEFVFCVENITTISPKRTYWEKLLILHGAHYGYRDSQRLPADRDRVSRHYYDVAMITAADTGVAALSNHALLDAVRSHNLIAFRQAWKKFEEAVPGTVRLVPQSELRAVIETDYGAMEGMILGDAPGFGWVMEQLQIAEVKINQR